MNNFKEPAYCFGPVKERVKTVCGKEKQLEPPVINNWLQVTSQETELLENYIQQAYNLSHQQNQSGLNPQEKETLDQHLNVMHRYYDVMWQYPSFKEYFTNNGISRGFFTTLVQLHDFSRYLFNGSYPLRYTDCVSDGLIGKLFPTFPKEYLHPIDWLTGEKPAPSPEILQNLQPVDQVCGLVLKAVDTLGKIEPDQTLRNPTDFFATHKGYDKWLNYQKQMGRFPFPVLLPSPTRRVRHEVTAEEYAEKDRELTMLGLRTISKLTAQPDFSQIQKKISELLLK